MPRRPPIDPEGYYHVGSRGSYGQPLYADVLQHEVFLQMYTRVSVKYGWETLAWALMMNHYHFVIHLSDGGLSEGMRELNGSYSRWRNEIYGQTGKGHLVRHGFFARALIDERDVIGTCTYVDLNPIAHRSSPTARAGDWSGLTATLGRAHPRRFHRPAELLQLLDRRPEAARRMYRQLVCEGHARRGQVPSPNDVFGLRPPDMIQSAE